MNDEEEGMRVEPEVPVWAIVLYCAIVVAFSVPIPLTFVGEGFA